MAGKILPNAGRGQARQKSVQAPGKAVASAFSAFVFWLLIAIFFPYPILLPYWAEALEWGPRLIYLIAAFNLVRMAFHMRWAIRAMRPNLPAGRASMRPNQGRAAKAPPAKQSAEHISRAEARQAKDERRAASLPYNKRPPTVQRMR